MSGRAQHLELSSGVPLHLVKLSGSIELRGCVEAETALVKSIVVQQLVETLEDIEANRSGSGRGLGRHEHVVDRSRAAAGAPA